VAWAHQTSAPDILSPARAESRRLLIPIHHSERGPPDLPCHQYCSQESWYRM